MPGSGDKLGEWERLVAAIKSCRRCRLAESRRNAVPGEGSLNADVLFLGEAPGRMEDLEGRPFVGAAGRLLNRLLSGIGLRRGDVFITNVVKCRPPNNRDPREDEVEACKPFTESIIRLVSPKVIVTLGNHAGRFLVEGYGGGRWRGITAEHGRVRRVRVRDVEVVVVPTYHPAAALYNPRLLPTIENDFKIVESVLKREVGTEKEQGLLRWLRGGSIERE